MKPAPRIREFDLFGDEINAYDATYYTPAWVGEMHGIIAERARMIEYHSWLRAQAMRWDSPIRESLGGGWERVTLLKL
jgi:hypothetical protein